MLQSTSGSDVLVNNGLEPVLQSSNTQRRLRDSVCIGCRGCFLTEACLLHVYVGYSEPSYLQVQVPIQPGHLSLQSGLKYLSLCSITVLGLELQSSDLVATDSRPYVFSNVKILYCIVLCYVTVMLISFPSTSLGVIIPNTTQLITW
jgi:hypothetical protein